MGVGGPAPGARHFHELRREANYARTSPRTPREGPGARIQRRVAFRAVANRIPRLELLVNHRPRWRVTVGCAERLRASSIVFQCPASFKPRSLANMESF